MKPSFVVFSERRYGLNKNLSKNIKFRESYSLQHSLHRKTILRVCDTDVDMPVVTSHHIPDISLIVWNDYYRETLKRMHCGGCLIKLSTNTFVVTFPLRSDFKNRVSKYTLMNRILAWVQKFTTGFHVDIVIPDLRSSWSVNCFGTMLVIKCWRL